MIQDITTAVSTAITSVAPAVVGVGSRRGAGSGLVIEEGLVLTSAHNLVGDDVDVVFADGSTAQGTVRAADLDADVGLVEVDTPQAHAIAWRPSDEEVVHGTVVVALTNPAGRGLRATVGTVSSLDRSFRGPRGRRLDGGIEHTAALPRRSSGSPLLDTAGRLIGINTVRLGEGFYVAIPADDTLRERIDALRGGAVAPRVRLGIALAPARVARRLRAAVGLPERDGLLVHEVEPEAPAAGAGVARGDLLVSAAGQPLVTVDDLHRVLDGLEPGQDLELGIVRGVEEVVVSVTL